MLFVAIWPRHFKSPVIKALSGPTFVRLGYLTHNRDISWSTDGPSATTALRVSFFRIEIYGGLRTDPVERRDVGCDVELLADVEEELEGELGQPEGHSCISRL